MLGRRAQYTLCARDITACYGTAEVSAGFRPGLWHERVVWHLLRPEFMQDATEQRYGWDTAYR